MEGLRSLWDNLRHFRVESFLAQVLDFVIVAFLIYYALVRARGTRAWQILITLGVFICAYFVSGWLQLMTLRWLLEKFIPLGGVAIVILLYPELRQALEGFGRLGIWGTRFAGLREEEISSMINQVARATSRLAQRRTGALIVIEREVGLEDCIATGSRIDSIVSTEIIESIFHTNSPIHDGAIIIRGLRIVAASCLLPLTERPTSLGAAHTRHRAAIGMSEQSDAVVVVVSEETGGISIASEGRLNRGLKEDALRERLHTILRTHPDRPRRGLRKSVTDAFSKAKPGS
jgi:diadenylate cyclase